MASRSASLALRYFARRQHLVDEGVLFRRQADVARWHTANFSSIPP